MTTMVVMMIMMGLSWIIIGLGGGVLVGQLDY